MLARLNSTSDVETAAAKRPRRAATSAPAVPWRERELLPLKLASEVSGRSVSGLYADAHAGKLKFRDFGGRTMVEVQSLVKLLAAAPEWKPRDRGRAAREARKRRATSALLA